RLRNGPRLDADAGGPVDVVGDRGEERGGGVALLRVDGAEGEDVDVGVAPEIAAGFGAEEERGGQARLAVVERSPDECGHGGAFRAGQRGYGRDHRRVVSGRRDGGFLAIPGEGGKSRSSGWGGASSAERLIGERGTVYFV